MRVERASNLGIVVQARTTSARLPDKINATLYDGASVLDTVLSRLQYLPDFDVIPKTYVAVPESGTSLQTKHTVEKWRAEYFVCPEHEAAQNDVYGRFRHLFATYGIDACVRITADCPLICPSLILDCVTLWNTRKWDYVATDGIGGVDVEVFDVAGWLLYPPLTRDDHEHVTPRYARTCASTGRSLILDLNRGQENWPKMSVDTPEDLERVRGFLEDKGIAFSYDDLVSYLNEAV